MPDSKMPALGRFPSFSKRHASFNTPREIPLPSPVLTHPDNPFFASTTPPLDPLRPLSIPEPQSSAYSNTVASYFAPPHSPPRSTTWIDRNSSASLPLPSQIPFYALQRPCPSINSSNSASSSSSSSISTSSLATSESDQNPSKPPRPPTQPTPTHQPHTLPTQLPQPDPPTILETTLPDSASALSTSSAPYAPFLSTAPPPADCRLEINTTDSYYRLDVRLPGFTRDGITLATQAEEDLHVVADMWGMAMRVAEGWTF